jgi:uncharacterized spore protein YtfJ
MAPTTDIPHEAAATTRVDDMLTRLSDRLGTQFSAQSVFAPAAERDGVTVIPVATVRYGLGGGGGEDREKHQDGAGAGAGGTVTPIGYIELKDGRSRYVPLVRPARMLALIAAASVAALAVLRPLFRPDDRRTRRRLPRR